ncbi:MAG: hypothetical protein H5T96_02070 [Tissierellales bacterium]|nr:hypothetical protein [Tissierellales bacterium]
MNKHYLGIDTSNYTSSISVINESDQILLDQRIILDVPLGKSGLRQQEAVFQHLINIPKLIESINIDVNCFDTVSVSSKPRQIEGSYMPVFKVGVSFAEVISKINKIPIKYFSHQEGHIASIIYENNIYEDAFVSFHFSGGTTEIILVKNSDNLYTTLIGGTNDISFGQLIDRIGVYTGLKFPCGEKMEKIACLGSLLKLDLPKPQNTTWINLSGLENFYKRLIDSKKYNIEDIFYTLFINISYFIENMVIKTIEIQNTSTVLIVGGVSTNNIIRNYLSNNNYRIKIYYSKTNLSSDNAVGVGFLGKYKRGWED